MSWTYNLCISNLFACFFLDFLRPRKIGWASKKSMVNQQFSWRHWSPTKAQSRLTNWWTHPTEKPFGSEFARKSACDLKKMSILLKSQTWRWIVTKTRDSKPFFFTFATVCGVIPGIIGYFVMQTTNSGNQELEAELRRKARPDTLVRYPISACGIIVDIWDMGFSGLSSSSRNVIDSWTREIK